MRLGEIWTAAGDKDHSGKPRPAVIVQDDRFDATDSIIIRAFTNHETDARYSACLCNRMSAMACWQHAI